MKTSSKVHRRKKKKKKHVNRDVMQKSADKKKE